MTTEPFDYQYELGEVEHRAEAWLRNKGWKHTSSTGPGCYWLWVLPMPQRWATVDVPTGALMVMSLSTAVAWQERADAWARDIDADEADDEEAGAP